MNSTRLEGLTNEEKRAFLYKEEADQILLSVLAYEREGETAKAATALASWNAKRSEIREKHP